MGKNVFNTLGALFFGIGAVTELYRLASTPSSLGLPMDVTAGKDPYYDKPAALLPGEADNALNALRYAANRVLKKTTTHVIHNIDDRVRFIQQRINEASLDPAIIEAARTIVSTKSRTRNGEVRWTIRPKDYKSEVAAVYAAIQNAASPYAMRYVRDHLKVDVFTDAKKAIRLRSEDCDGGTIVLGALLMAIGYPIKLRIIQDTKSDSWSHIYPRVGLPNGQWVPLDWSMWPPQPVGWEAPGAAEAKRTGRPAGMVVKVKDYDV